MPNNFVDGSNCKMSLTMTWKNAKSGYCFMFVLSVLKILFIWLSLINALLINSVIKQIIGKIKIYDQNEYVLLFQF